MVFGRMTIVSLSMHWTGLLGSTVAQPWYGQMVAAGVGDAVLFASVLLFGYVTFGAIVLNARDPFAMRTPAGLAYAGPLAEQFSQHHYLAPGMRTW